MKNSFDFTHNFDITLTCASGVESVLKKELVRLGYSDSPAINGSITFNGTAKDVARCNLNLRTCDRVYIRVGDFVALSFDSLFDNIYEIEWENILPKNANISVNGKCVKSTLFSITDCQKIVKKAIVKRLSEKFKLNRLPEDGELYQIEFHNYKDTFSVLLNTSGAGLHKRGYRDLVGIAPIKETLASALILSSDYYYKNPFADLFCGSGTIAIETAKIALNIAGCDGRKFAFEKWNNFSKKHIELAREEAKDLEKRDCKPVIFASDIDRKAVELAKHHAERAGVDKVINFAVKDVKNFKSELPFGTIVTNPPYGERVFDKEQAEYCYKALRNTMDNLDRWSLFLITSAKNFEKVYGLKADKNRKLFNSNKECKFYYYYAKKDRK